jgi:ubiquinone/menaquinone biosynthesis C-methylase UbiE
MGMKIDKEFMVKSFGEQNTVEYYKEAVLNIGLWKSEQDLFTRYFKITDNILDIGCGAGRTTVGLYKLKYNHIIGIDFIPNMVDYAKDISTNVGFNINYQVGDVTDLEFNDNSFNGAIFSFNGFMQIPDKRNRIKALNEIRRVLKPSGIYIFTSNDRRIDPDYQEFWKQEKEIWNKGMQDKRLIDFGDRVYDMGNRQMFMHFETPEETILLLNENGFNVLDHFSRNSRYTESDKIIEFCTDCRFWITQKV